MAIWSTLSGSAGRVSVSGSSPEPTLLPSLSLSEPSVTNTSPWRIMSTWRSESKDEEGGGGGRREGGGGGGRREGGGGGGGRREGGGGGREGGGREEEWREGIERREVCEKGEVGLIWFLSVT